MNTILAYVIWNYFSFNFIQIKKNAPTFLEFGLYNNSINKTIINTVLHYNYYFNEKIPSKVHIT